MIKTFLTVLFAISGLLFAKCIPSKKKTASIKSDATGIVEDSATLIPEDVSILFPIKAGQAKDPIFEIEGDGLCLVPSFSLGSSEDQILPKEMFAQIQKNLFSDQNGNCPAIDSRAGKPSSELLKGVEESTTKDQINVAKVKGMVAEACVYENWKVIGFRFDPCVNRSRFGEKFSADKSVFVSKKEPSTSDKCLMETRLIAHPVVKDGGGNWRIIDESFHLIYSVDSFDDTLSDLLELKKQKMSIVAKNPWPTSSSDVLSLRPHAALRAEMPLCLDKKSNGAPLTFEDVSQEKAPFTFAFHNFLKKHTNTRRLTGIAFMMSDRGPSHWTFGTVKPAKTQQTNGKSSQPLLDVSTFNINGSFSESEFNDSRFPFDPRDKISLDIDLRVKNDKAKTPNIERFWVDEVILGGSLDKKLLTERLQDIHFLENPHLVSQSDPDTCFSCHLLDQTGQLSSEMFDLKMKDIPGAYKDFSVPTWSKLPFREVKNLRNFGYAAGMQAGIASRTRNETDDVVSYLNVLLKKSK